MDRDPNSLWRDTRILLPGSAPQMWENIFTGEKISLADAEQKSLAVGKVLLHFPVALLKADTTKGQ
jgi:maltooligosyltrehalose synthase